MKPGNINGCRNFITWLALLIVTNIDIDIYIWIYLGVLFVFNTEYCWLTDTVSLIFVIVQHYWPVDKCIYVQVLYLPI